MESQKMTLGEVPDAKGRKDNEFVKEVVNDIDSRFGSSSFSSIHDQDHNHKHIYDVYISFRGADTGNRFTDHLYNTLLDAGFITFLDDEDIESGEPLKHELKSAIISSRASIIVLSKTYASSTRCLDELVLILEQKSKFNQIVVPIFYDVEPTDVRKQQRSFGEAMEKHKQRMEAETNAKKRSQLGQKMRLWNKALTQVTALSAEDAKGRKETDLIDEVITHLNSKLDVHLSNTMSRLIGMDRYIQFISSWLTDEIWHTADILTLTGECGMGKTSLAKYLFRLHSGKFQKSSFIEDINTRCKEKFTGLLDLQKQLHKDISKRIQLQVDDVSVYTSKIEKALDCKKVFIVLDDIGSPGQLDDLLGNKGLHPGSKIILTTKDASLTERCALFNTELEPEHTQLLLNGLCKSESLELLCIHAFKRRKPKQGYKEILEKVLNGCDGQPFVLQILGKSLYMQDVSYWEDYIDVLQKEPRFHINQALKMSFNSLPFENDKDLFMHIACFFVGTDRDVTEIILNACDIYTSSGITNLIDRCLLSIGRNNELMMHQLVQEMGRDLVRQESPNKPWKRSRLWCHEESFEVLTQKNGKGNLLGLALDMRMLDKKKLHELETESLSKMDNLMLLQLNYVRLNGCFENFPKELRWLCMHGSPLKSIPIDLPMENLVALDMSYSNIESFDMSYTNPLPSDKRQKVTGLCSKDKRLLGSLKILDLSFCEQLLNVSGFLELPTLERLIVRNCISLVTVCESVEQCVELVHIDLSDCYKLKTLPMSIGKLKKIKTLCLDGCNFQTKMWDINSTDVVGINPQTSTSAIMETLQSDFKRLLISQPSLEIDGMVKIQPMEGVEEKLLQSLWWTNLEFIKEKHLETDSLVESSKESQIQMYYEFGIFSTIYEQEEMPDWISCRFKGSSISFTIPSSPKELRGLNLCNVETLSRNSYVLPMIKIHNITKGYTWIYVHCIERVRLGGKCVSLLSHWVFGPKEMTDGDLLTITVATRDYEEQVATECGIGFVYAEDGEIKEEEKEESVLGYYKSWNHIIGGDLSAFQLTTGEYLLHNLRYMRHSSKTGSLYLPFIDDEASYKEEKVSFKAFSERSLK